MTRSGVAAGIVLVLAFLALQWSEPLYKTKVFQQRLVGWPARFWIEEQWFVWVGPGEKELLHEKHQFAAVGLALDAVLLASAWIALCVLDGALRCRQIPLRGLVVLMLCAAMLLGGWQTSKIHNRSVESEVAESRLVNWLLERIE